MISSTTLARVLVQRNNRSSGPGTTLISLFFVSGPFETLFSVNEPEGQTSGLSQTNVPNKRGRRAKVDRAVFKRPLTAFLVISIFCPVLPMSIVCFIYNSAYSFPFFGHFLEAKFRTLPYGRKSSDKNRRKAGRIII